MLGENMLIFFYIKIKDTENGDLNSESCEQGLNSLKKQELGLVANQL